MKNSNELKRYIDHQLPNRFRLVLSEEGRIRYYNQLMLGKIPTDEEYRTYLEEIEYE